MLETNRIYQGDALELIKQLDDESVDCLVTSPPYWGLRDYGVDGQLGLEPTFQLYLDHLMQVMAECKRVLKKTGTMWVNIGDSYGGDKQTGRNDADNDFRRGRRESGIKTKIKTSGTIAKSLVGIPERFAIEMSNPNWVLRDDLTEEERIYVLTELVKNGIL